MGKNSKKIRKYIDERKGVLKREDVLRLIKLNGGPRALDLNGCDLSGINLIGVDLTGIIFGSKTTVKYGSIRVVHNITNLRGAWLERANLTEANLGRTDLRQAHFYKANLTRATLWTADATDADFRDANLYQADLYSTVLRDAKLTDANLRQANLQKADLRGTAFGLDAIGSHIIQDRVSDLTDYYNRWYISDVIKEKHMQRELENRHQDSKEIYLALKNAFLNAGRYQDASQAYFKEKQTERKLYAPWNVSQRIQSEQSQDGGTIILKRVRYLFKWLGSLAAEYSCGYGERPFRTVIVAAATILLFAILYWLSGGIATEGRDIYGYEYILYSLSVFSTISFDRFQIIKPIAEVLASIETLVAVSFLALLMFALGNRISRS